MLQRLFKHHSLTLLPLFLSACSATFIAPSIIDVSSQNTQMTHHSWLASKLTHSKHTRSTEAVAKPDALLKIARSYLGTPYRYGGTDNSGMDCSGFVLQSFSKIGIYLPRTSQAQAQQGMPIASGDTQKGDLVFFATGYSSANINHVGIMLNSNTFIHASSSQGVIISRLDDTYWQPRYQFSKRIIY